MPFCARAGQSLELFDWIFERICATLEPDTPASFQDAEMTAREVWICFWRGQRLKRNVAPEPAFESSASGSAPRKTPVRIEIENPRTGAKLIFGSKRRGGRFFRPVRTPMTWFPEIMVWRNKQNPKAVANPMAVSSGAGPAGQGAATSVATAVTSQPVAIPPAAKEPLCAGVSYGLETPLIAPISLGIEGWPDLPPDGAVARAPLVGRGSSIV